MAKPKKHRMTRLLRYIMNQSEASTGCHSLSWGLVGAEPQWSRFRPGSSVRWPDVNRLKTPDLKPAPTKRSYALSAIVRLFLSLITLSCLDLALHRMPIYTASKAAVIEVASEPVIRNIKLDNNAVAERDSYLAAITTPGGAHEL